jgi:diacylglycerol kinase (ATP)
MKRKVQIVANPAAGQDTLNIKELNSTFREAGVDWDLSLTKEAGDATRLAQEAIQAGVDVVAAYGGDGTVAEVARALVGSNVPLAIFPGGTANVMSVELGIPGVLTEACALVCQENLTTRAVDAGMVDEYFFLLRVGIGFEAKMVEGADRTMKDRLGNLAYILSALKALGQSEVMQYKLTLDGQTVEEEGIACMVANSGNLGLPNVRLAPTIDVSDGLLDVILVNNKNLATVTRLIGRILGGTELESPDDPLHAIRHWQAREIRVESTPEDSVQCDGELIGTTPKDIRVLPAAIQVVVPAPVVPTEPPQGVPAPVAI